MNSQQLYESVIEEAMVDGPPPRHTPVTLSLTNPLPVAIASAGFYPNRWVGYCDDYLGGGPSYDAWLKRPVGDYVFANGAHHTRGACVTDVRVTRACVTLRSRACNWVPTGILDLKLLAMTCDALDLPGQWTIDDLNLDHATVFSYREFSSLKGDSEFAKRARRILDETDPAMLDKRRPGMLGRHKKAVRRGRQQIITDESRIQAFTMAIPRDFVWASYGAIRESWVMRTTGKRGYGEYQWDRLDYPELAPVLRRVGPVSLDELAVRRSQRG